MDIQNIDKRMSTSAAITAGDVKTLAELGVALIVCNRPDNESADQTAFSDIEAAASAAGIRAVHIPFAMSDMSPQHVAALKEATEGVSRVHGYCRSGMRAQTLYQAMLEA